jgi:hypothetical protein
MFITYWKRQHTLRQGITSTYSAPSSPLTLDERNALWYIRWISHIFINTFKEDSDSLGNEECDDDYEIVEEAEDKQWMALINRGGPTTKVFK